MRAKLLCKVGLSIAAASALVGCDPEGSQTPVTTSLAQAGLPEPPPPPPAPGPNFANGSTIASPAMPDISALEDVQLDAMFDAAVAQARPGEEKRAICVGIQGLADKAVKDPPQRVTQRLGEMLRLPAVPASRCKFDIFPSVIATQANAILYTVKVASRDERGILTFWATATYGNLGANGVEFRLVRANGRWTAKATGVSTIS